MDCVIGFSVDLAICVGMFFFGSEIKCSNICYQRIECAEIISLEEETLID